MNKEDQRPNILFIMADDHGSQAIGAYGSRVNQTPNLDRIAEEGIRFDHCYVTNSICTPSRATILTGTHNHVNRVTTLRTHLDNRLPNVAKHMQQGGYQTAMIGKWHLGIGRKHQPTGFDFWSVLPGQGFYRNPHFIEMGKLKRKKGYVSDIITKMSIDWLENRDQKKPFFLMCHHKAPHRPWHPKEEHRKLYTDEIPRPESFDDDYKNRANAAVEAKMRIARDMCYNDLDLRPPLNFRGQYKMVPSEAKGLRLKCKITGKKYTFSSDEELKRFKYQRYMQKYLQTVHSIEESTGQILDYLDKSGLAQDTLVIYTSDQGFYLGEHGWYDKRFIYEESFKMPFMARLPGMIKAKSTCVEMASNVDFAPTFLEIAGLPVPNYMQGRSLVPLLKGESPEDWTDVAYHRYWQNQDETHNAYAHYGIRTKDYKLIYWYNEDLGEKGARKGTDKAEWELFDLKKDPLELFNCYHQEGYESIILEMMNKLEMEMHRIGDIPRHK